MRIDAGGSADVRAAIQALQGLDREVRKAIRTYTRKVGLGDWQAALTARGPSRFQRAVLVDSARLGVSDQNVTLRAATSARRLKGGFVPRSAPYAAEFGGDREKVDWVKSRGGRNYKRHITRQLPVRRYKGWVVWPAAATVIPRLASLWVQTVVRTVHEVIENR